MNWVQTLAVVFHVLLALGIVGLVLLQRGRGADAGAGFGAGASGTVFGARGSASFLSRMTAVLATLFFLTSLGLSYLFSQGSDVPTSVMDRLPAEQAPADSAAVPKDPTAIPADSTAIPADSAATEATPAPGAAPPVSEPATPATEPAPAGTNE